MPGAGMYGLKSPPPPGQISGPFVPIPHIMLRTCKFTKTQITVHMGTNGAPPQKKNQKVIYNIYINTFQGD